MTQRTRLIVRCLAAVVGAVVLVTPVAKAHGDELAELDKALDAVAAKVKAMEQAVRDAKRAGGNDKKAHYLKALELAKEAKALEVKFRAMAAEAHRNQRITDEENQDYLKRYRKIRENYWWSRTQIPPRDEERAEPVSPTPAIDIDTANALALTGYVQKLISEYAALRNAYNKQVSITSFYRKTHRAYHQLGLPRERWSNSGRHFASAWSFTSAYGPNDKYKPLRTELVAFNDYLRSLPTRGSTLTSRERSYMAHLQQGMRLYRQGLSQDAELVAEICDGLGEELFYGCLADDEKQAGNDAAAEVARSAQRTAETMTNEVYEKLHSPWRFTVRPFKEWTDAHGEGLPTEPDPQRR